MSNRISGVPLALAALGVSACTGVGPFEPGGLELRVTAPVSLLEAIGSQTQLELEFPDGLTTVGLEADWRSSNPSVASVDANGMVTALGQGSATITVDADIVGVARVRSDQTDTNAGNDSATVRVTVQANGS